MELDARLHNILLYAGKGTQAFCSGGDQSVRGKGGYVGADEVPRLNVLDLQVSHSSVCKQHVSQHQPWAGVPASSRCPQDTAIATADQARRMAGAAVPNVSASQQCCYSRRLRDEELMLKPMV